MSSFPFLKLPFLAQEIVLLYLYIPDITDFSLCSKRCQRVVQRIRHPYTGIKVDLFNLRKTIDFQCKGKTDIRVWSIDWRADGFRETNKKRRTINGHNFGVSKSDKFVHTNATDYSHDDLRSVLDYSRETFNLKVLDVQLWPENFEFRQLVAAIGECQDFYCYNRKPMLREDYKFIEDNVRITGSLRSPMNFID